MSELFPEYQPEENVYLLGVREIVRITSAPKAGKFGLYFLVASAPLPEDMDLETFQRQGYQSFRAQLTDFAEQAIMFKEIPAFEVTYR